MAKGDPLCPLGFHPQVRWPTRCKRCFRDYKEHSGKKDDDSGSGKLRKDELTASTPILSDFDLSYQRYKDNAANVPSSFSSVRSSSATPTPTTYNSERRPSGGAELPTTTGAQISSEKEKDYSSIYSTEFTRLSKNRPSSWSAQDLSTLDDRKLNGSATGKDLSKSQTPARRVQVQSLKEVSDGTDSKSSADVEFILQVKSSKHDVARRGSGGSFDDDDDDDDSISAFTETTETTLIECNAEAMQEVVSLKKELEIVKVKCERLEREKNEMGKKPDGKVGKATAGEVLKLQQKLHEVESKNEDLVDEKKIAQLKVKELEKQLHSVKTLSVSGHTTRLTDELKKKLTASEHLVEELMEDNEELKKEMTIMIQEMDELHDNFREDQADEYRDLKKELEQTAKNCRILQFKLRKSERRLEQIEAEKVDLENRLQDKLSGSMEMLDDDPSRVKMLEQELTLARDLSLQMQKELQGLQEQLKSNKDSPSTFKRESLVSSAPAPHLSKSRSLEGSGLRRQASEESQLVRDLQDCLEREADLREQLKFSEEEGQSLRKKVSRLEEENESLVMQLKKMAGKKAPALGRKVESHLDKDEGISDDLDINDLRLQLELNEQEASILRRKLEEKESENDKLNDEINKLTDELSTPSKQDIGLAPPKEPNDYYEQKMALMGDEMTQVRLKLIEKERDIERLESELIASQKAKKVVVQRSRSLDSESAVDLKRQLQAIEQECTVLRQRTIDLENENEKVQSDNRRLQLRANRRAGTVTPSEQAQIDTEDFREQIKSLEKRLSDANTKIKELNEKQGSPRTSRSAAAKLLSGNSGELNVLKREKELIEKELKSKEDEFSALKKRLKALESENKALSERIGGLGDASKFRNRTPKRVTDLTTKNTLKKMVDELEQEICDMTSAIALLESQSKSGDQKVSGKDELEVKSLKAELEVMKKEKVSLTEKHISLEAKISSLETEASKLRSDTEVRRLQNKVTEIEKTLSTEKEQHSEAKKKLEAGLDIEQLQKVRQEKHKLQKELLDKDDKITDVEKKLKELEDKIKRNDRFSKDQKDKLTVLEKELETERLKLKENEVARKELREELQREKDELKEQQNFTKTKIEELESSIIQKERKTKELELSVKEESRRASDAATKKAERDIKAVKDDLQSAKTKIEDLEQKIVRSESDKRVVSERQQKQETELKKEKDQLIARVNGLEIELKTEKKKRDRLEKEKEQERKEKDEDLITMKVSLKKLEGELKAANDKYQELNSKDSKSQELEVELEHERQEYEDLTAKYDLLEEDFVVTKANLVMDKEQLENDFILMKREFDQISGELRALRETFNFRQDTWIKEKLDMQEKVREMEDKIARSGSDLSSISERQHLKDIIEEKNKQIERAKDEADGLKDQLSAVRKEADDVRKKLEDFDRVSKAMRNMSLDTTVLDKEVKELKSKLMQEEKVHRSEMAQVKMRFDQRLALMNEEAQSMQLQNDKFKRERDTFKDILEGAQKMIGELKADPGRKKDSASEAVRQREIEDTHQRLQEFHGQITNLEDELTEARMEASRIKTEYINDKSNWDVKFAEFQTKINELEEDRVMSTGRSRIPGTKTRLEIAWQKEREEFQRLVTENAALAKDLRQTLFEVERERDRERLEAKRRLEQMQRSIGEEQDDVRKKVTELQCDLLELRDAHAKLRTTCEKLRRDKERVERERDELRESWQERHKTETEEEKKLLKLIDDVQKVRDLSPLVLGEYLTSEPQKEVKSKDAPGTKVKGEFLEALRKVSKTTDDLKKYHRLDLSKDYDPMKRRNGDTLDVKPAAKKLQSYKRSQSLEQSQAISDLEKQEAIQARQFLAPSPAPSSGIRGRSVTPGLQRDRDSSMEDYRYLTLPGRRSASVRDRETSEDRLSDYSTTSEIIPSTPETRKKKSLVGKLKQLTKSKSIESSGTADIIVGAGIQALAPGVGTRGSDLSLDSTTSKNTDKEKKTVKDRLTGFFKKGPPSRTQSIESDDGSDISELSSSRPVGRIGGSSNSIGLSTPAPIQRVRGRPPLPTSHSINDPCPPNLEIEKLDNSPKSSRHLTPGYEPSMSPAGYSALLTASGGGPKRLLRPFDRSQSAAGLKSQGSFETNV